MARRLIAITEKKPANYPASLPFDADEIAIVICSKCTGHAAVNEPGIIRKDLAVPAGLCCFYCGWGKKGE